MLPLMTTAELEAYVRRAMNSRRYNLTIDEAISELHTMAQMTAQQEETVRFAFLISNDGT